MIDGTINDDVVNGTSSSDTIAGLAGRDTLNGGDGNDTIYGFGPADATTGSGSIALTRVASTFASPVFAASAPNDPNTLYVLEKDEGRIRKLNPATGAIDGTAFLDIPNGEFSSGGEAGVLGFAFHPNYAVNGLVYVFLTTTGGDLEVRRYTRDGSGNVDLATMTTVITVPHPGAQNHNGGWIAFGSDGYLYIATGDGGGGGDPNNNAQNKNSLLGKILRIDVNGDDFPGDGTRNYAVPATNPFVGVTGADEVYHYGLRNPWRPSFDSMTGDFYIADVGQGGREEVDFRAAGSAAGANFGWKVMEGTAIYDNTVVGNPPAGDPSLVGPVAEYSHVAGAFGGFSITGGYVYRGPAAGGQGLYFFSDYVSGQLWTLHMVGGVAQDFDNRNSQITLPAGGSFGSISSFAVDGSNNLYAIGLDGEIFRIDPGATAGDSADTIFAGNGNDQIWGGVGADQIDGGGGLDRVMYPGARSAYTLNLNGSNWTISGPDGTDAVTGVERAVFSDQTLSIRSSPSGDFSGEGRGDFLWQTSTGQAALWLLNGTQVTFGDIVGPNPGVTWHIKGAGDFDGNGYSDILWQTDAGQAAVWQMKGTQLQFGDIVGPNPGPTWHIVASGDFNGDLKSDILWQTDAGQAAIWLMNGTQLLFGDIVGPNPGPTWHVAGSGDFNGDGKSDILWQTDTGRAAVWLMNGTQLLAGDLVGPSPGTTWHIRGTGDFNGDGKSDILWQTDAGQAAIWLMNSLQVAFGDIVGPNPGPSWQVKGASDLNGDGRSDILWQTSTGQPAAWLMNGTQLLFGDIVGPNPGTNWNLVAPTG